MGTIFNTIKKGSKMTDYKKSAIIVGILFLVALILNLIATEIFNPILNTPEYLDKAYPEKSRVVIGNLLNIICGIAMIFIPIALIRVVPKKEKQLARAYIVFRAIEGLLFLYLAIKSLSFISLSEASLGKMNADIPFLQTLGDSVHSEIHWATIVYIIIFTLGGFTFYSLLFRSKLLPKFLSVWGFFAIALLFVGIMLAIFDIGIFKSMPLMKGMTYFAPPIAINELVLGIWLIGKGFNSHNIIP